jgi:hypothetical protein
VLPKPDKRILAFQETMRQPEQDQWLAKMEARRERDRLRQEQKRRAAGILSRSTPPPPMPTATDAAWFKNIGFDVEESSKG